MAVCDNLMADIYICTFYLDIFPHSVFILACTGMEHGCECWGELDDTNWRNGNLGKKFPPATFHSRPNSLSAGSSQQDASPLEAPERRLGCRPSHMHVFFSPSQI